MDKKIIKHKVCIITAARSEYGLLQWLISDLEKDPDIDLSLVVAGSHLSPEQGLTARQIEEDRHSIARKVEFLLDSNSALGIAKSAGLCGLSFADVLNDLSPDLLIILGDRYELLPISTAALLQNIPIAHISGGDVTEGAIDNQVRNAITMMASIHFPGTEESAANIVRMRGSKDKVFNVGEPGLETFLRRKLLGRYELAESLGIEPHKKWIICTLHPETRETKEYNLQMAKNMIEAVRSITDSEVIITASNADLGGNEMNDYFKHVCKESGNNHFIHSLGQHRYLSIMKEAHALIGNTSSGIVEAPFLGIPVVNIGNRQLGRHLCPNIISVGENSLENMIEAIKKIPNKRLEPDHYYGDGETSNKIIMHVKEFLSCQN